jgi:galactoside O-acetyltransferase
MKFRPAAWLSYYFSTGVTTLWRGIRYQELKKKGNNIRLGEGIMIVSGTENIKLGNNIVFFGRDYLDAGDGSITIGDRTNLNTGVVLDSSFKGEIIIGNDVQIGPNVVIIASSHNFKRTDIPINQQGHTGGSIKIEDDVWIGANCVITSGVVIGKGAIIGAGAVVTHNIDAFTIAGGIPAKPLSVRRNNG